MSSGRETTGGAGAGQARRSLLLYVHTALIVGLWISLLYFAVPAWRDLLVDEDRLLETLSAVLDLGAFVYALRCTIGAARKRRKGWAWPAFLALVGLWSFLEEMSYGRRLFGFGAPRVRGVEIDALHDYVLVGKYYLDGLAPDASRRLLALVVVVGLAAVGLAIRFWPRVRAFLRSAPTRPTYLLFALYVLLMAGSQSLDIGVIRPQNLALFEEIVEFSASLALFFSCSTSASW